MFESRRAEAPKLRLVPPPEEGRREERKPLPRLDDGQLVAAMREGDPSAAGAFYDRARPIVDRAIFRVLGRRDRDHDDIAQIAMIALIDSIERFRGDCPLDGWISTVTAHTVFKHLRRRKLENKIFAPEELSPANESRDLALDRRASLRTAVSRIRGHLNELESNKAWTFLLHHVCGYDLREIADITEVSVAAAQQRLSRGRRELLARLREDPDLVELLEGTVSEVSS
jgi:RNA polymerase sigma-70 factor, ECF subfamily